MKLSKINKIFVYIAYTKLQNMLKKQGAKFDEYGVILTNYKEIMTDFEEGIDDKSIEIYKNIRAFGINKKILTNNKILKITQEKYNNFSQHYQKYGRNFNDSLLTYLFVEHIVYAYNDLKNIRDDVDFIVSHLHNTTKELDGHIRSVKNTKLAFTFFKEYLISGELKGLEDYKNKLLGRR